jgi:hypothetical protein
MRSLVGQRRQRVNRSFLLGFVLFVVGIVLATVLAIPVIASSQDFKARESAIVRVPRADATAWELADTVQAMSNLRR